MANYDIKEESLEIPYLYGCGKVFEVTHDNVKYLVKSATEYVYDDPIGDIYVSHFRETGHYIVNNFELLDDNKELDLTWLDSKDRIALKKHDDYESIKCIKVNFDNIDGAYFPKKSSKENYMTLVLNANDTKIKPIYQIKTFKKFISGTNCFDKIKFEGFNPTLEKILSAYAVKNSINIDNQVERAKTYTK